MSSFKQGVACAAIVVAVSIAPMCAAADAGEHAQPTIEQLISRLGSDDFDERNAATEKLAAMGEIAREGLEKAAAGNDPDIRLAAGELLARLGQTSLTFLAVDRDGKPIAGAQADLTLSAPDQTLDDDPQPQNLTTREDGTAHAEKIEPGAYDVLLNWNKYSSARGEAPSQRLRLKPGANRVIATLTRGGTVQCTALGADGKPLKGAQLAVGTVSGATDADGKVKLENVPDGTWRAVWKIDTQTLDGPLLRVAEGKITELPPAKVSAKGLGSVKITLQKPGGEPVAKSNSYVSLAKITRNPASDWAELMLQTESWMMAKFMPTQHSDENGKIALDAVEPGTYRLLIRDVDAPPDANAMTPPWQNKDAGCRLYYVEELQVQAGAATELTLKPIAGGTVKGQVVSDTGKPPGKAAITLVLVKYAQLAALHSAADFFAADFDSYSARVDAEGKFELNHVTPGKYVLLAHTQEGRAYVFNLSVTDGQTTVVAPVKMPAIKPAVSQIKGKVLLPDGKPCADADLYVSSAMAANQISDSSGEDGAFEIDVSTLIGKLSRLKVSAPGYHTERVELSAAGLDLQNLIVHLRPQAYGGLHLSTVDEAGKPVAGVRVWPGGNNPSGRLHTKVSNAHGEVVFTGLAAGAREFNAEKAGYVLPPSIPVTIVEDRDDTAATVTLRSGLKISGHVELPPDVPRASAGIVLTELASGADTWTTLNASDDFTFSGLAPGEYLASAVAAGCEFDGAPPQVAVAMNQTTPPALKLRLLHHGGAAINLGPALAGRSVKLMPADMLEHFDQFWKWYAIDNQPAADAAGRVEFLGAPGEFVPFVLDDVSGDAPASNTVVARAAGTVTIQPLKLAADVSTLTAKDASIAGGSSAVTVAFTPQFPDGAAGENLATLVDVLLVGKQAICSMAYSTPSPEPKRIVGTPPPDFELDRQTFTAHNLPPGDYKLIALLQDNRGEIVGQTLLDEHALKDGETADLGEIKLAIPKVNMPIIDENGDDPDPDKEENFKP